MKYILLITVHSRMVHWPETVNIPNISCIMLEYTLLTICMNLCYVGKRVACKLNWTQICRNSKQEDLFKKMNVVSTR